LLIIDQFKTKAYDLWIQKTANAHEDRTSCT